MKSTVESYKKALYFQAVADKVSALLREYDFVLAGDKELADALTLRDIPCSQMTVGRARRLHNIPNKWQRMRQHLGQAQEWVEQQESQ
jgi:hypothetical protein